MGYMFYVGVIYNEIMRYIFLLMCFYRRGIEGIRIFIFCCFLFFVGEGIVVREKKKLFNCMMVVLNWEDWK